MTLEELDHHVAAHPEPVILLEGRRSIPVSEQVLAVRLGRFLAVRYPNARFRSGNAEGSDAAFMEGVAMVDPSRLELVLPYAGHKKKSRVAGATYTSPETLGVVREQAMAEQTIRATPANRSLIEKRGKGGALGAKAAYLIRDTMKVTGMTDGSAKPVAALFWVDAADPEAGGTGHTIRVCRQEAVPVVVQAHWKTWLPDLEPVVYPKKATHDQG